MINHSGAWSVLVVEHTIQRLVDHVTHAQFASPLADSAAAFVFDSPVSPRAASAPKSVVAQTGDMHEPNCESLSIVRTSPCRESVDTMQSD